MNIKGIIFDMDGVLLDSTSVKKNAYFKLFPKYNDFIRPIVNEMDKLNRETVITHLLYKIKEQFPEDGLETPEFYFQRFVDLTQEQIMEGPYVAGAKDTLANFHTKIPLAVNTMTPDRYAIEVLQHFHIDKQMDIILGGTTGTKVENIQAICQKWNCEPNEIVFVGDGITDLNCARELHLVFVGIKNSDNDFETQNLPYLLYDLTEFTNLIHELKENSQPLRIQ